MVLIEAAPCSDVEISEFKAAEFVDAGDSSGESEFDSILNPEDGTAPFVSSSADGEIVSTLEVVRGF